MTHSPHDSSRPDASALRCRRAWGRLLVVLVIGLTADLVTKWAAFRYIADAPVVIERAEVLRVTRLGHSLGVLIPPHEPVTVIPGVLDFTLVLNKGAVFGIGAGGPWVLLTLLGLGVGVWMFGVWTRAQDRAAHFAVGMLMAGGVGNLYDRVVYACVRDFIHPLPRVQLPFGWRMPLDGGREIWPYVSNVADLWLILGIVMFMWHLWRTGRDHSTGSKPATGESEAAHGKSQTPG